MNPTASVRKLGGFRGKHTQVMKDELSLSSIKPRTLREASHFSLFQKTAIFRYHNEGRKKYTRWFDALSPIKKFMILEMRIAPLKYSHVILKQIKL